MERPYDCNYSKFNLKEHSKNYINYLEAIIDEEGNIEYAHPSHIIYLENKLIEKIGNEKFKSLLQSKQDIILDYMQFLCKYTNCIAVWNDFIRYYDINTKQIQTLQTLKNTYYLRAPNSSLYKGDIPYE